MKESSSIMRMEHILALAGDDEGEQGPEGGTGRPPPTDQQSRELYLAGLSTPSDNA